MTPTIVRGGIHLPCSSPRNCRHKFLKLLRHIDPDAEHGFGFEGVFLKPGTVVTDAQLRPSAEYPETPLALEHMLAPAAGHRRHSVYILWRYEANAWRELGRAASSSWEWAIEMRPLALRALRDARTTALVVMAADLPAISGRIAAALECELRNLEPEERLKVIGVLHDQFAARLCA